MLLLRKHSKTCVKNNIVEDLWKNNACARTWYLNYNFMTGIVSVPGSLRSGGEAVVGAHVPAVGGVHGHTGEEASSSDDGGERAEQGGTGRLDHRRRELGRRNNCGFIKRNTV